MKTKLTVSIDERTYTLASPDSDTQYMEQVAAYVDEQIGQLRGDARISAIDAATMAALNIADNYYKERAAAENLRGQLKAALDDANRLKKEISDLKMENFRLSQNRH